MAFLAVVCACAPALRAQDQILLFPHAGAPPKPPPGEAKGWAQPTGSRPLVKPKLIPPPRPGEAPIDTYGSSGHERGGNWPFAIDMTRGIGCTGTLIGPQVLLTAAHCLEQVTSIRVGANRCGDSDEKKQITGTCAQHPFYRPLGPFSRLDYGLCHLDEPFPSKVVVVDPQARCADVRFQRLSTNQRDLRVRDRILLSGFGCSSQTSETIDGEIRAGLSAVARLTPLQITLGTPFNVDSSVLCPGDSGGAAYRYTPSDIYDGPRAVVGVNSASYLAQGVSYIARTSAPTFRQFLNSWRARWPDAKVCGLDPEIDSSCHPKFR